MNPRRSAKLAVALSQAVLSAWLGTSFAWSGSDSSKDSGVAPIADHAVPSRTVQARVADPPISANGPVAGADAAAVAKPVADMANETTAAATDTTPREAAASTGSLQTPATEAQPVQLVKLSSPDPDSDHAQHAASTLEILDECLVVDPCIDRYLWALYRRAPKEDTIKVQERRKVTIKRKGKTVTVTRSFTKLVDDDFTWKDPKAAERAQLSMTDYVIGGMDRGFKLKLFQMLHAAEEAGLSPGITSAFRDDYRQSIASGLKAASNRSYHGGSLRGGYGHGLAADVVSVKGDTRDQRWASSELLWKWIDANGKRFGIGRPYLDRDPGHVAPMDGKEYAARRRATNRSTRMSDVNRHKRRAAQNSHRSARI